MVLAYPGGPGPGQAISGGAEGDGPEQRRGQCAAGAVGNLEAGACDGGGHVSQGQPGAPSRSWEGEEPPRTLREASSFPWEMEGEGPWEPGVFEILRQVVQEAEASTEWGASGRVWREGDPCGWVERAGCVGVFAQLQVCVHTSGLDTCVFV